MQFQSHQRVDIISNYRSIFVLLPKTLTMQQRVKTRYELCYLCYLIFPIIRDCCSVVDTVLSQSVSCFRFSVSRVFFSFYAVVFAQNRFGLYLFRKQPRQKLYLYTNAGKRFEK